MWTAAMTAALLPMMTTAMTVHVCTAEEATPPAATAPESVSKTQTADVADPSDAPDFEFVRDPRRLRLPETVAADASSEKPRPRARPWR
jgi:hypothetical protein